MTKHEKEKKKRRYVDAKAIAEKQQQGFELTSIEIPKGYKLFQFKEGLYKLVVMPFVAKKNPNCDEGMSTWERTYFAHSSIGPENRKYTCPYRESGKPCPIHEHAIQLRKSGADHSTIEALEKLSKRQLIAVFDLGNKAEGIQIYEGPFFNGLGEIIGNKLTAADEDSPYHGFFHEENPMKLIVKTKKGSFETADGRGGSFVKCVNLEMEPLKEGVIDSELYENVPCLDDCVKVVDYKTLKKILDQEPEEEPEEKDESEDENEEPTNGKSKSKKDKVKASKVKEDEDEDEESDDDSDDSDSDSDDDDEDPFEDDDESDDDENDEEDSIDTDEEDEEKPKKKKSKK